MNILVIPDIHLKPWMFERAAEIMRSGAAERAVCLMDIPDDWGQEVNLDLYRETFAKAIKFQKSFPETLWCYGNHDLSYVWNQSESGFSPFALPVVMEKLRELQEALPDERQMAYIHRIDDVLFLHGGLTHPFVKYYASDLDYEDTDGILRRINTLDCEEMWDDASPIWYRPQFDYERMYRSDVILQIVGHTPMEKIQKEENVISCDVFSTYSSGEPIGDERYLIIDTMTWEYKETS